MLSAIQRAPAPSGPASIGVRQSSLPVMTSVGAVTFGGVRPQIHGRHRVAGAGEHRHDAVALEHALDDLDGLGPGRRVEEAAREALGRDLERERLAAHPVGLRELLPDLPVRARHEVGLGRRAVEHEPVDALGIAPRKRERDHAAHRRPVHVRALDADRIEEPLDVVGPELHRILLLRPLRQPVPAQIELDDLEMRRHLVGDEPEVLVREPRPTDLQQEVLPLPVHLVPDASPVDLSVSHRPISLRLTKDIESLQPATLGSGPQRAGQTPCCRPDPGLADLALAVRPQPAADLRAAHPEVPRDVRLAVAVPEVRKRDRTIRVVAEERRERRRGRRRWSAIAHRATSRRQPCATQATYSSEEPSNPSNGSRMRGTMARPGDLPSPRSSTRANRLAGRTIRRAPG